MNTFTKNRGTALFAAGCLLLGMGAFAQQAMLGDLNRDGSCNVMDVQAAVCQALQVQERTWEADIDGNGEVDVLDVQHAVNTALGTGGLLQRIQGTVECDGDMLQDRLRIRAVSQDGQMVEGDVDPDTGEFQLTVRTMNSWAFAFFAGEDGGGPVETGALSFSYGQEKSVELGIPALSQGDTLDLGQLQFAQQMSPQEDTRKMLGTLNRHMYQYDGDGDGIPDCVDPLMNRVMSGPGVPQNMERNGLDRRVAECISSWLDEITAPSLTDENEDGIPDFIEPLIACLEANISDWFEDHGHMVPQGDENHNGIPDTVDDIVAYVLDGLDDWLAGLDDPDLIDANGNGIPDYLEAYLDVTGGPNFLDADGDGVPDFAADDDGDGIPNCQDPDYVCDGDRDGDGIPNDQDIDDDNDGVPDYADVK